MNNHGYYSHAGGDAGYYCEIRLYPELGLGSVIMFNSTGMKDIRFLNNVDIYFIPLNNQLPTSYEMPFGGYYMKTKKTTNRNITFRRGQTAFIAILAIHSKENT